jgi:hypothetical protein
MNITINYEKPREVKNPCLRKGDVKSQQELLNEIIQIATREIDINTPYIINENHMRNACIEGLARRILNVSRKNRIVEKNESDIALIKDIIVKITKKYDVIDYSSCITILQEVDLENLSKRAITMALRDLYNEGILREKRISVVKVENGGHWGRVVKTVYERI